MLTAATAKVSDAPGTADLVLRNGRIFTGDPARPQAAALAVSRVRFTVVGDETEVAALIGPETRVVDVLGRRVIPGLNDSHIHLIRGGVNYLLELRWDGVPSLGLALRMLRRQAERTPPGQWVRVVGGWSGAQFAEKRLPTVSELNAAAPDTPVLVLHLYQSAILNRAAVAALGYGKETPDPPAGRIVRDHAGNPTGVLLATPAPFILYGVLGRLPVLDPEQQVSSTRHFLGELNRFGITSAIEDLSGRPLRTGPNLVDRATALAMYTVGGARLSGEADVKGTISPGKYADLAVLSADYFDADDADVSHIESVLTIVGGKIVWSSAEFEGIAAPLPAPTPAWSPVTEYGGYQSDPAPTPPVWSSEARS